MPMFEEPRYIYGMSSGRVSPGCAYAICKAGSPSVRRAVEHELHMISDDNRSKAGSNEIRICGYCGGLWWEEVRQNLHSFALLGFSL